MLKQETFYEVQSWGCVSALLGLPAELIPHDFPEAVASGKRMLKQEIFYLVASWGCVTEYLGLPAELIPQMFVPCLTTGVIIPAISRIVNHFRKIFPRKLKKAKQNPAQNIFPLLCRNVFFVMPVPAGFYFQALVHLLSSSKNIVPLSHLFYKPTLL